MTLHKILSVPERDVLSRVTRARKNNGHTLTIDKTVAVSVTLPRASWSLCNNAHDAGFPNDKTLDTGDCYRLFAFFAEVPDSSGWPPGDKMVENEPRVGIIASAQAVAATNGMNDVGAVRKEQACEDRCE